MAYSYQLKKSQWLLNTLQQIEPDSQNMYTAICWLKKFAFSSFGWHARKEIAQHKEANDSLRPNDSDEQTYLDLSAEQKSALENCANALIASLDNHIRAMQSGQSLESTTFEDNVGKLAEELKMDETDKNLILFFAEFSNFKTLFSQARNDFTGGDTYFRTLADIIGSEEETIRQKLSENGILRASEIINFAAIGAFEPLEASNRIRDNAYSIDKNALEELKKPASSGREILERFVGTALTTELTAADFAHVPMLEHWAQTVAGAIGRESRGKVFLLDGSQGTGKTEFMSVLAQKAGCPAYSLCIKIDDSGEEKKADPIVLARRAIKRADYFAGRLNLKALFVLDDAEYAFRDTNSKDNPEKTGKPVTNALLDNLGITLVIITNDAGQFDPAYRTRMQPSFTMPPATAARKALIIKNTVERTFPGFTIDDETAAALAASSVALSLREIGRNIVAAQHKQNFAPNPETIIDDIRANILLTLKSRGGALPAPESKAKTRPVNPALWNTACAAFDPLEMVETLKEQPEAGGLFHLSGPPGTGRRSFARYAAAAGGRGITECSLSDFIDPMTRGFIDSDFARMLERAAREGDRGNAVLITNAGDMMSSADPVYHPFFRRLQDYPLAFVVTNDSYRPEEQDPRTETDGTVVDFVPRQRPAAANSQRDMIADIAGTMASSIVGAFNNAGLPLGQDSGNYRAARGLMTGTVVFMPYVTQREQARAFETVLPGNFITPGMPQQLPPFTIGELMQVRDRAERLPTFDPDRNGGYLGLLCDRLNLPRQQPRRTAIAPKRERGL